MKKCLTLSNVIYFVLMAVLLNSYMLVKASPYTLIGIVPLFLFLNIAPGMHLVGTKRLRLRICNHGTVLLAIFVCSLIPSLIYHVVLAFLTIPHAYMDLVWSLVYCIVASALLFWNGIACVYCTSTQMGIKWRLIGALCGMIPGLNLFILTRIIDVTAGEVEFEIEKEIISHDPALSEICKTKYPIVLVHGVFFRDNKLFNYWGRVPRTLKLHGATIYYGEHQSALTVKESARRSTAVSVASAHTRIPTGVAAVCLRSRAVPTEVCPSGSASARAAQAAASISAARAGVANTRRLPLPIARAVLVSFTVLSAWPVRPGVSSFITVPPRCLPAWHKRHFRSA